MTPRVRRPRAARVAAAVLALPVLVACGADPEPGERANAPSGSTRTAGPADDLPADDPAALGQRQVTTGLTSPWGLAATGDGRVLLSERDTGRILLLDPATGQREELRTLPDVVPGGEAGLLGLALTPDESALLAYYTVEETSRIVSMPWDGQRLGEPEVLLAGIPGGAGYHQGGQLVVGPDDLLYVGTGDNGVPESAQDTGSLSGKVLRLTLEGEPAPGNPFDNEVYSYGHRNVQGLAFDEQGRLWASEFGANAFDELNLVEAGADHGWPDVEGSGGGEGRTDPVVVWSTADASPSGLAFWDGSLWMAALRGQRLWEIPLAAGAEGAEGDEGEAGVEQPVAHLAGELGRLRSVLALPTSGAGGAGELLLVTSNTDGRGEVRDGDDRALALTRP
ncbi:glucose/arabinose dehydrogenase [Nocardioides marinisabuli]|uniref:Glucose/arabinose dehydrogenase n=1 Tax=Nocardioides marinisabuli TaxID=419476 RepID=A0A7Y9F1C0_9ACTN|nr:PQQ-dependent sugar dehydrogenase [Nocardioides marinisabuli]NYD56960.1 glucose/arabinose dehydrogenase [Nocardioides marinisabuli]